MYISACPHCAEQVTIPAGASPQAQVRCPLCQEEYLLAEAIDRLPPLLEVLSDPGDSAGGRAVSTSQFSFGGPSSSTAVAESSTGDAAEFQFDERPAPRVSKAGTGAPSTARPAPRPRRKPKKPAVEIAKVVGGGVVGILLAILLIWWVAGKDPFKIAPKVHGIAPFLVPQKVMDKYEKNNVEEDEPSGNTDKKPDEGQESRERNKSGNDDNSRTSRSSLSDHAARQVVSSASPSHNVAAT